MDAFTEQESDKLRQTTARDPPQKKDSPEIVWIPIEDAGWAVPDQPEIVD